MRLRNWFRVVHLKSWMKPVRNDFPLCVSYFDSMSVSSLVSKLNCDKENLSLSLYIEKSFEYFSITSSSFLGQFSVESPDPLSSGKDKFSLLYFDDVYRNLYFKIYKCIDI